jgi:tetratricopeptide (TPR) repeat protein
MDRLDNAVAECRQSLAIFDRLSSDFPGLPQYRERVATRCADLALLLATADRNAEAERYYSEAVEAMEQLIAGSPQDAYRQRLCSIYQDQGDLMLALSRRKEATSAYRRAIELLQGVVARAPDVPLYVRELAAVLAKCPVVELRDTERAVELAERASHLAPEESASWYTLGLAQYRAGNFPAALAALKEWEEQSAGSDSREWFLLAITCWQLGNAPGATEEERARYQKEAHRSYARGVERQEQHKALNKDLFRLRAEAAALLSINESAPPPYLQPPPNL